MKREERGQAVLIGFSMLGQKANWGEEAPLRWTSTGLLVFLALGLVNEGTEAQGDRSYEKQGGLPDYVTVTPVLSPPKSPVEALQSFDVAPGFAVELVACEPLIEDPVVIDFDPSGRLLVAEMRGFMRDLDATGQFEPIGRVAVLEDRDGDGRMDHRTTWLDGLVLPRAVRSYRDGVLIAEHGKLWFTRDTNGDWQADEKTLVDGEYATSGSVEHRANGLLLGMDNWIYNARSRKRYRFEGGEWQIEPTESRGQWGLTQDDFGRLYYNFNWSQLHCDLAPPNGLTQNQGFSPTLSVNAAVTRDQRVYPIRMNTAVNRGYRPGILNEEGRLREFASACSPWIYRGGWFPEEFRGNALVCAPGANTIKRNLVREDGLRVAAVNGYENRDWLASTDERFRPVSLSGGPDGALYVVDMYRGVIQQSEFMTSYLRADSEARSLAEPIHWGRIYRVVPESKKGREWVTLDPGRPGQWLELLSHRNGWVRDRAQQRLVYRGAEEQVPGLRKLARSARSEVAIQALWVLQGMGADCFDLALELTRNESPRVAAVAMRIAAGAVWGRDGEERLLASIPPLLNADGRVVLAGVLALGSVRDGEAGELILEMTSRFAEEPLLREGVLSILGGRQQWFLEEVQQPGIWEDQSPGRSLLLQGVVGSWIREEDDSAVGEILRYGNGDSWKHQALRDGMLAALMERERPVVLPSEPELSDDRLVSYLRWPGYRERDEAGERRPLTSAERKSFVRGQAIYASLCASCHGAFGKGMSPIAPPLRRSDWVLGDADRLIKILLHGMEGAVEVNGKTYAPPQILPAMPPIGMMSDGEIAAVSTFVRRAWGHEAEPVVLRDVARVRALNASRVRAWTVAELNGLGLEESGE